jgi:hypothetical protein
MEAPALPLPLFTEVRGRGILRSSACEEGSLYAPVTNWDVSVASA